MFSFLKRLFGKREEDVVPPPVTTKKKARKMVTAEQLKDIFPGIDDGRVGDLNKFVETLNRVLTEYDIVEDDQIAKFLAQVGHESGNFKYRKENLNYSEKALLRVFGKYFDVFKAKSYARKPEMIANVVYANRMGNGDTASGDGWKYRGRGYIQLTGKNNYTAYAKHLGESVDFAIEFLETIPGSLDVAGWFFMTNNLKDLDMKTMTRRINGGYNGLEHRLALYEKSSSIFT